jgi:hypothetical protein
MIADETGSMPKSLELEADRRFFERSLDRAAVVAHGRMSQEDQPGSPKRRRLILTRKVARLAPDPNNRNARLWNPAGASLEEACVSVGCHSGTVAVLGGPDIYSFFLNIGYDDFYLSGAPKVKLPGGVPLFVEGRLGKTPDEVLSAAGLKPGPVQWLDDDVTLVEWTPKGSKARV